MTKIPTSAVIAAHLTPLAGLSAQWRKRSPRERLLVSLMGFFLFAVCAYFVGYLPAQEKRQALQIELPRLRQDLAELMMLMQQHLARAPSSTKPADAHTLQQSLPTLFVRAQLDPKQIEITVLDATHLRGIIQNSDYASTMNVLSDISQHQGLRMTDLSVQAPAIFAPGQANFSVDWQLSK